MLVTQVGALDVITYRATFAEKEEILRAYEYMAWDYRVGRESLVTGVDLVCYECDDVENVYAELVLDVYYPSELNAVIDDDHDYECRGIFTYLDTEESDELIVSIANFDCGDDQIEIVATITYMIQYVNGVHELYQYEHEATIADGEFSHERRLILYVYNDDDRID